MNDTTIKRRELTKEEKERLGRFFLLLMKIDMEKGVTELGKEHLKRRHLRKIINILKQLQPT